MSKQISIVLTGGGTAGHVLPNLALVPLLNKNGFKITYIGSNAIEKRLVSEAGLPFIRISSGKLRRYWSWENFVDIFRVFWGFLQAFRYLFFHRPNCIFSKGGFVSVPVVLAARLLRIPVIAHESDYSPGLATRVAVMVGAHIVYTFEESSHFFKANSLWAGPLIREGISGGSSNEGCRLTGLRKNKPILLVMGGSLGAGGINKVVEESLPDILSEFHLIHITGPGKKISFSGDGYYQAEFVGPELCHLYAVSDLVLTRAGSNSIHEILLCNKPMILVPLPHSRGDQIQNADLFQRKGWAAVIKEEELTVSSLKESLQDIITSIKSGSFSAIKSCKPGNKEILKLLKRILLV